VGSLVGDDVVGSLEGADVVGPLVGRSEDGLAVVEGWRLTVGDPDGIADFVGEAVAVGVEVAGEEVGLSDREGAVVEGKVVGNRVVVVGNEVVGLLVLGTVGREDGKPLGWEDGEGDDVGTLEGGDVAGMPVGRFVEELGAVEIVGAGDEVGTLEG
jgi:hypothetical protein